MYLIYADDELIYDSTLEDYKIGKGSITREINKAGSFTFSIYPDHFYYNNFVKLKTIITVYKSGRIVFRGRVLNDTTDYWNNKVLTCEGELGFLQDSIIRPFDFSGTPAELFAKFITEHNAQVDASKRFKIGTVTVNDDDYTDDNNDIERSNSAYESALSNMNSRLLDSAIGGNFYITHGENGQDDIPTIHYLAEFPNVATQTIEFGTNLKNFTKAVKAEDIATAIIPLGAEVDDENDETENPKLTIESVNNGRDYVYSEEGVALYGWIFKVVEWEDITTASALKAKALAYLDNSIYQNVTLELNAIDLHLLDPTIESISIGDHVRAISKPHNFDTTFLCSKQTIDLLNPENDSYTLGHTYKSLTETNTSIKGSITAIKKEYATKKVVAGKIKQTQALIEMSETQILTKISETYVSNDTLNSRIQGVESSITQTANSITQSVKATYATKDSLSDYVTNSTFNERIASVEASITTTANSITASVKETYAPKSALNDYAKSSDLDGYATKDSLSGYATTAQLTAVDSKITQTANSITATVSATYAPKSALNDYTTNTAFTDYQNTVTGQLALKIGKDENDKIVSMLNASANQITITSNRLSITSDKFTLNANGSITCSDVDITGGKIQIPYSYEGATGQTEISSSGIILESGDSKISLRLNYGGLYYDRTDDNVYRRITTSTDKLTLYWPQIYLLTDNITTWDDLAKGSRRGLTGIVDKSDYLLFVNGILVQVEKDYSGFNNSSHVWLNNV